MNMPDQRYCLRHNTRLMESNVNRFDFDTLLIFWVINNKIELLDKPEACYCCEVGEEQFVEILKAAAELETNVEAGGGSYSTDKLSISRGRQ